MSGSKQVDSPEAVRTESLSFAELWKSFTKILDGPVRRPIDLFDLGTCLLSLHNNGLVSKAHEDLVLENVLFAAIDLGCKDWANFCMDRLFSLAKSSRPTDAYKSERLTAILLTYDGSGRNVERAINMCRNVLTKESQHKEFRYRLATLMYQENDIKGSVNLLTSHVKEYPLDSVALKLLLRIYINNDSIKEAITVSEDILISEMNEGVIITLAELVATSGDNEAAIEYFCQVLTHDPTNLRVLWEALILISANEKGKPHYKELKSKLISRIKTLARTNEDNNDEFADMIVGVVSQLEGKTN